MTDPERLVDGAQSPVAKRLLAAARDERPPEALVERTLLAVGATSAVLAASASASAASVGTSGAVATSAKASGMLVAAKWLGMGALGGALLTTVAYEARDAWRQSEAPPAQASHRALMTEPARPAPARESAGAATPVPLEPPPQASIGSSNGAASASVSERERSLQLTAEVAALDAARHALGGGDATRALRLLDAYRERFPEAHLLPEALRIRMEALYAQGNRAEAARIAERLLAGFPKSPHAARARRIADEARR